ncbi:MAG TPA: HD domain-containing phosphohydrolase [Gammaproteobacteria bacterium]|nr:HD domain-containing phosphohydrolase [Gammaproteobacteria bacterium]
MTLVAAASGYFSSEQLAALSKEGLQVAVVQTPADLSGKNCTVLCLSPNLLSAEATLAHWQAAAADAAMVADQSIAKAGVTGISKSWPTAAISATLHLAAAGAHGRRQWRELGELGAALAGERNPQALLALILTGARSLAGCDAAGLFLIDKPTGGDAELVLRLAQNASVDFTFQEQRLPLNRSSIAGYVSVSGEEINVADAYAPPAGVTWRFNDSFDRRFSYRSVSLYAVPLRTPQGAVIGALEFINRKREAAGKLDDTANATRQILPFDAQLLPLLRAFATQAAAALENTRLLLAVENMFEGFVTAAVTAIEQRDPVTNGHSFRVARMTTGLAQALPRSGVARFNGATFNDRQLRELRYAALLHDFGKIGVRENVLVKSHKLTTEDFQAIQARISVETERLKRRALAQQLVMLRGGMDSSQERRAIEQELQSKLAALDAYWGAIQEANEPELAKKKSGKAFKQAVEYSLTEEGTPLLTAEERRVLSIPRGSLSAEERREIEAHVLHTYNFLRRIPWPEELAAIPEIAGAHHEKLDGSGYPRGRTEADIPLASRLMTVADIYDALTATDRPYRKSLPSERAFRVLEDEAQQGKLDSDVVRIFIDAKVYDQAATLDSLEGH